MIVVEEVAGVGSRARVVGLALNSIGALSFSQRGRARVVGVKTRVLRGLVKEMLQWSSEQPPRAGMGELGGSKEYFWLRIREDFLQEAAFKLGHNVYMGFQ